MKRIGSWLLASWMIVALANSAGAVSGPWGSTVADGTGRGVIEVGVNPRAKPEVIADQITNNLQLTNGGQVETVSVENGIARIEFKDATPGSTVEGNLPFDIASAITEPEPETGANNRTGAYIGLGAVVVTGGVLGGLAAAGKFSGNGTERPSSSSR